MNEKQLIDEIRKVMAKFVGPEKRMYEVMLDEADGWRMRLNEIEE